MCAWDGCRFLDLVLLLSFSSLIDLKCARGAVKNVKINLLLISPFFYFHFFLFFSFIINFSSSPINPTFLLFFSIPTSRKSILHLSLFKPYPHLAHPGLFVSQEYFLPISHPRRYHQHGDTNTKIYSLAQHFVTFAVFQPTRVFFFRFHRKDQWEMKKEATFYTYAVRKETGVLFSPSFRLHP